MLSESERDSKALLDKIYCVNYKALQQRPRLAHPGTSKWLYNDAQFREWILRPTCSLLWMSGMPGMGKSVLARALVEDAMAKSDIVPNSKVSNVVHYFCTYVEAAFNNEETVIRSLLHQFLQAFPHIHGLLRARIQDRTRWGVVYRLDSETLWQTLEEVLSLSPMKKALLVIDAIEELPTSSAIQLLRGLHAIIMKINANKPSQAIKIFITSRHSSAYRSVLPGVSYLQLQRHHIEQSIKRYITATVLDFAAEKSDFAQAADTKKRFEIADMITKRADGMFLWAEVAWKSFRRGLFWNADIVEERLQNLSDTPAGLNSLYEKMLDQVDVSVREDMWTIFAVMSIIWRPLSSKALGLLLSMNLSSRIPKKSTDIQPFNDVEGIIQNNFPNLIRLEEDGTIKFIHLSFKEYIDNRWKSSDSPILAKNKKAIARSCLQYLKLSDVVSQTLEVNDIRGEW
jgi:hypothetical protein